MSILYSQFQNLSFNLIDLIFIPFESLFYFIIPVPNFHFSNNILSSLHHFSLAFQIAPLTFFLSLRLFFSTLQFSFNRLLVYFLHELIVNQASIIHLFPKLFNKPILIFTIFLQI